MALHGNRCHPRPLGYSSGQGLENQQARLLDSVPVPDQLVGYFILNRCVQEFATPPLADCFTSSDGPLPPRFSPYRPGLLTVLQKASDRSLGRSILALSLPLFR